MKQLLILMAISAIPTFATVKVTAPISGSSAASPVHFVASATTTCSKGVSSMGIYTAPYVLAYKVSGSSLNTYLTLSSGTYNAVVQEWDACGSTKTALTIKVTSGTSSTGTIPSSSHVFVVVEENHSYSQVIGSSSMPYLNSLANKYGLSTQYYANTHPSIGNYFMMTAGQTITNNDSYCSTLTNDNIVRHLLSAGKTWKSYAESLPYAGYTGCGSGNYAKKHNPLAFFSDVANSSEKYNLVPFTQFSKDLANNNLPNFSFIVPNLMNDAHDGTLSAADNWLKANIAPLISSATFQKDGILIIVFDESLDTDTAHGGGHIACLVIGPKAKPGMKPTVVYQHQNLLKTVMKALGMSSFPGAASSASAMTAFF
ncbi:MAG TPA: alkaline phosphatase family protein [Terriglobales bacterium]|jgi:acid phosphatase|nr:alkaline phosphatase family protein [Terriglobales bacterium]